MIVATHRAGKETQPETFPWLGVSEGGTIVLFTGPGGSLNYPSLTGVIIAQQDKDGFPVPDIGHRSTTWSKSAFWKMNGEVVLRNT